MATAGQSSSCGIALCNERDGTYPEPHYVPRATLALSIQRFAPSPRTPQTNQRPGSCRARHVRRLRLVAPPQAWRSRPWPTWFDTGQECRRGTRTIALRRIIRASMACHIGDLDSQNRRRSASMRSVLMSCAAIGALSLIVSTDSIAAGRGMAGAPPMAGRTTAMHQAPTRTTTAATRSPAHTTGQPNQTCGSASAPNTPGNAAMAAGSAFNPSGKAGSVYAGQQPQNSRNSASVSQYDVACSHQP